MMARNEALEWIEIADATMRLALESADVVGLRAAKAAKGGSNATDEAWLMWSEKVQSLAELQTRLFWGSMGTTPATTTKRTLTHYRRKVAANRRRLRQSK
jgi:hypothetical protein